MDLTRAFDVQAAEAAVKVAVPTAEGETKLTPSKAAALKEFEGQGQGDGLGGDAGTDGAPHHGNGHSNSAALVGVDGDKACCEGGGRSRDLICPECSRAFLSEKAMYGHLRCHPCRGYKGATRPAALATAPVAGAGGMKPKKALPLPARFSAMARKEGELPTKWPVKARRGRTPTAAYAGSNPTAVNAGSAAVLQSSCSDEEAAMILLGMSSGGATLEGQEPEPELHMSLMHAPDAVVGHQMPGLDQLDLLLPDTEVKHPLMPVHADGAVVGAAQHVSEAEKPAEVEPTFKVAMEPQAPEVEQALPPEHVAVATAATEVETPVELEPVEDAVIVPVRNKNMLVSPSAKKPKKRRLDDLAQMPPRPAPAAEAAEVEVPVRRIPSPASNRKHACPRCFKQFPTHQALGGHMAYHNKAKISAGQQQQLEGQFAEAYALKSIMSRHYQHQGGGTNFAIPSAASGVRLGGLPPPLPAAMAPLQHQCSRCSLVFSTGQALGGHMRKHWLVEKKLLKEDGSVSEAALAALAVAARPSAPASAAAAVPSVAALAAAGGPSVAALAAAAGPSAAVLAADAGPSAAAGAGPSAAPRNFDLNELPSE